MRYMTIKSSSQPSRLSATVAGPATTPDPLPPLAPSPLLWVLVSPVSRGVASSASQSM